MNGTRVDILDALTGAVVGHCQGPTLSGQCPRLDEDGVPPCSGHRIVPMSAGPDGWLRWVSPASRHCPLAWNEETGTAEYP